MMKCFALIPALMLLVFPAAADKHRAIPENQHQIHLSFAPLVKRAAPAVVNIHTKRKPQQQLSSPLFDDPFFRRFFGERFGVGPKAKPQHSLGSGVIVDNKGLIVTNYHVIKGAETIKVALTDRSEFTAKLVLEDESTDLAVLKVDVGGRKLPALRLADSDKLQVGDLVLAIGNPFNVGQTVTNGIVSALARTSVGITDFQSFIQTDAAINPGNSGGALVDMKGRLVGVNTAIFSGSGGSHGIGFAVPANMVRVVLQSARAGASFVQRPWLGIATQPVTQEIASSMGRKRPEGVIVRTVYPKGPADKAGIKVGDMILTIDGQRIDDEDGFRYRVGTKMIGGETLLNVLRNGERRPVRVALLQAPELPARNLTELTGRHPLAGAEVANLSPALAEEMGFDPFKGGVVITRLRTRSEAAKLRLKKGDVLLRLNGEEIADVATLQRLLAGDRRRWRIQIRRGQRVLSADVNRE